MGRSRRLEEICSAKRVDNGDGRGEKAEQLSHRMVNASDSSSIGGDNSVVCFIMMFMG